MPLRYQANQWQVLLVKAKGGEWICPKGKVHAWETLAQGAQREAWEEGGVEGYLWYRVPQKPVFVLQVHKEHLWYPEKDKRAKQWIDLSQALRQIKRTGLKQALKQVCKVVSLKIKH